MPTKALTVHGNNDNDIEMLSSEGNAVQVDITYRCNFRCPHCYNKGKLNRAINCTDLDYTNFYQTMKNVKPDYLFISGGEPLLHQTFSGILFEATGVSRHVVFSTNCSIYDDGLERFLSLKRNRIFAQLTLPAIDRKVFASMTGTDPDSAFYDSVIENMKRYSREYRYGHCYVNVPVSMENVSEMEKIADFVCNKLGICHVRFRKIFGIDSPALDREIKDRLLNILTSVTTNASMAIGDPPQTIRHFELVGNDLLETNESPFLRQ